MDFADPRLLEIAREAAVAVPRGEPRRAVAAVARALAAREPQEEVRDKLAAAAEAVWDESARQRVARAVAGDPQVAELLERPARENPVAQAVAFSAALPFLARDGSVKGALAEAEPVLAEMFEDERAAAAPRLARVAAPALGLDLDELKDLGYRYVATYPPEGSEGVDIVGRAAAWLTRRMTLEGDAPRDAMRRFLAIVAEEIELDLPIAAALLDDALAEQMPESPTHDRMFVELARGLVEEAVAERGPPF